MDNNNRKLPKSRKAMEYRVYWLERKLKHLKVSEHRQLNRTHIATMPEGPVKDLMHLNNEFHQANEQSAGLKNLTEELNKDTITLNERTERLHELAAEKLASVDRSNRQSKRIQDRGRQINKESLKTAAISRAISKDGQDNNQKMQRRIEEAAYLSDLTRAQHEATDELNRTTRSLNEEAVKTTASSLKINRHLADTTDSARELNNKAVELQQELAELKAELTQHGHETVELNTTTKTRLAELDDLYQRCEVIASEAHHYVSEGRSQIQENQSLNIELSETAENCALVTQASLDQQQQIQIEVDGAKSELVELADHLEKEVDRHLGNSKSDLDKFKANQKTELGSVQASRLEALENTVEASLSSSKDTINDALSGASTQLEQLMSGEQSKLEYQKSRHEEILNQRVDQFNQDARLRFIAVEERSKRLTNEYQHLADTQLDQFQTTASEHLNHAEQLVQTLSVDVQENLVKSTKHREETESLLESAVQFQSDTERLNQQTRSLIAKSNIAVNKVDSALDDVTNVSRKMFRETRELQERAENLNDISERKASELSDLNQKSLEIQSDSIQTQALSQEINRHSLDLNEQTQSLQSEFQTVRDSNLQLVHELNSLKSQLIDLGDRSNQQLEFSISARLDDDRTREEFQDLTATTENLNQQISAALLRAASAIEEVETRSAESQVLIDQSQSLSVDLEQLKNLLAYHIEAATRATSDAEQSTQKIKEAEGQLRLTTIETENINQTARDYLQSMEVSAQETAGLNTETREVQTEMRQTISDARQINDDFMRGLESLNRKTKATDDSSRELLSETRQLQDEMNGILDLKHGIDGFQQAVDAGQIQLNSLIARVDQCLDENSNHDQLVDQYQQRIETYHADVMRYRESIIQLEQRFRTIDEQFEAHDIRLEDSEHKLDSTLQEQRRFLEQLVDELRQNLNVQQSELDRTKQELKDDSESVIVRVANELRMDFDHKIDVANLSTSSLLNQTDSDLRLLNSEVQQLNRSLQDEITTLKNETTVVNEQHLHFQQEQVQHITDQRTRSQQQDFELDTMKRQLEKYQRLVETQLENSPHEQLQQRIKQLENNLRQQQRALKLQEAENEKPKNDNRVSELQTMVEGLTRSMTDISSTNKELKQCLEETRSNNQSLQKTNRELEFSLSTSQSELDHCLQRVNRIEHREATLEEALNSIKTRETDTQQTLQQMRSAVKDSTKTMRETQRTLESLSSQPVEKKRDWMSPKQAVMSSIFALVISYLGFFGFEEVNASHKTDSTAQIEAPVQKRLSHREAFADLSSKLDELHRANVSIVDLGEFAWPVNFGIVDPSNIAYKEQHQGISIEAELGDPVVAINDGTVIYSDDEIRGYGNMIVIQHDQDLLSVYANNQYNYVNEGDQVKRGQLIGDIGQLFNEDTAGLYFEIRSSGKATDPFNYLKAHATNESGFDLLSIR